MADLRGILGLPGIPLASAPVVAPADIRGIIGLAPVSVESLPTGVAGFRLLSLTGVVLSEFGAVVPAPAQVIKKANWGSWCNRFRRP